MTASARAARPPIASRAGPGVGRRVQRCGPGTAAAHVAGWLAVAVLAGCASGPRRDGPPAQPPADVAATPDAEPRFEPIRSGGPNKPYDVLGSSYTPLTGDVPLKESGLASWYGRKFHGLPTATGERYDMYAMTAAHKTMPLPSYARVRNPRNGREVIVRVNDRGPFHADRVIDLSYAAAAKLDLLRGVAPVEVERITQDDIRTGAWRRNGPPAPGPVVPETAVAATGGPRAPTASVIARSAPPATGTGQPADPPRPPEADPAPAMAPTAAASATTGTGADLPPAADPAPPPVVAAATAAPGFWIQLGAFRERLGAESFQQHVATELDWLTPLLALFNDAPLFRLQAGPYRSRDDAQAAAQRVRTALQLVPLVVERR